AHGVSTFFEFDPMPAHADDYAVARLARIDAADAPVVGGDRLIATPTVFRFKRGRVLRRQLRWTAANRIGDGDRRDDEGVAFPQFAIQTPPMVAWNKDRDWFLWLTRGSAYTTGFDAFVIPASPWVAHAHLNSLPCPVTGAGTACDFDASAVRWARTW